MGGMEGKLSKENRKSKPLCQKKQKKNFKLRKMQLVYSIQGGDLVLRSGIITAMFTKCEETMLSTE